MKTVLIALGGNLGDRTACIRRAIALLEEQIVILSVSPFMETPPAEGAAGGRFLNGVIAASTRLSPSRLFSVLQSVEVRCGRPAVHARGDARTIDLDLLDYDGRILRTSLFTLPHPGMKRRRFVLEPIAAIAPDWRHPVEKKTAEDLLRKLVRNACRS